MLFQVVQIVHNCTIRSNTVTPFIFLGLVTGLNIEYADNIDIVILYLIWMWGTFIKKKKKTARLWIVAKNGSEVARGEICKMRLLLIKTRKWSIEHGI